jgi:outer membrane receptor protein involved in Fe transport
VGGRSEIGNPDLMDAVIRSYDLRWEHFPGLGEVQAVSLFYKDFERPIEIIVQPGISRTVTYANSDGARNYGAEFEIRQRLGDVGEWLGDGRLLSRLSLGLNLTVVDSKVEIGEEGVQTSRERPLQGQSPFVVNGSLGYTSRSNRSSLTLLYNVFGRRITEVGANGLPDVYERARHTIDVTAATGLNGHLKLKLVAKNLLDHQHRFEQAGAVTSLYQTGRSFSLGLTYGL